MALAPALAWGGRAVPLWMQRIGRWAGGPGGVARRNPFTGSRQTGDRSPSLKELQKLQRGKRIGGETLKLGSKGEVLNRIPIMDKGGLFFRNPRASFWGAAIGGPTAAGTAYGLLSGDDKPPEETSTSSKEWMRRRDQEDIDAIAEKQPSMTEGHREDYLKKRRKRLKKGMQQLLNQYMILCMVAPNECDNFLKSGMKMMEQDQEFNDDLNIQDAYDTVFQPGNMPTSGRDAFARLSPLIGRKEAMEIAGDWGDLVPEHKEWQYKKKETMAMEDILRMPRGQAIEKLISMWASDTFTTPEPLQMIDLRSPEGQKAWAEYADATLDLMQSGGGGATSSGQILGDTKLS